MNLMKWKTNDGKRPDYIRIGETYYRVEEEIYKFPFEWCNACLFKDMQGFSWRNDETQTITFHKRCMNENLCQFVREGVERKWRVKNDNCRG